MEINKVIEVGDWFMWVDPDTGIGYKCQRDSTSIGHFGDLLHEGIGIEDHSEATHTYIVLIKDCKTLKIENNEE